jgi:hypothetical protein
MRVLSSIAFCSILMMQGCGGDGGDSDACSNLNTHILDGEISSQTT